MAKYKSYSYVHGQLIPVMFSKQIQPGTFEFTLNHLIVNKLDLSCFDHRFKNDETGAPAFDPSILLKIILFAYSRVSSPSWISKPLPSSGSCCRCVTKMGLTGKEMFAIDGCKLPSNACLQRVELHQGGLQEEAVKMEMPLSDSKNVFFIPLYPSHLKKRGRKCDISLI